METDNDLVVPMLTDEDIDNIMQDIDAEDDVKLESPNLARPVSSVKDVSVQENLASKSPLTEQIEIQELDKASEKTSPDDKEMDLENNGPATASDKTNTQSGIDAMQEHVVDSLLFLDHAKEIVSKKLSTENEIEVSQNIDEPIAPIHEASNENLMLYNEQKNLTEASEKINEDVNNQPDACRQESVKNSTTLKEAQNLEENSEKIDTNIESQNATVQKSIPESLITNEKEINAIDSPRLQHSQDDSKVTENIDNNIDNAVLVKLITVQEGSDKSLPLDNAQNGTNEVTDKMTNIIESQTHIQESTQKDPMPSDGDKNIDDSANTEGNVPDSLLEDVTNSATVQHSQENTKVNEAIDVNVGDIKSETSITKESMEQHTKLPENDSELKNTETIEPFQVKQVNVEESKGITNPETEIQVSKCPILLDKDQSEKMYVEVDTTPVEQPGIILKQEIAVVNPAALKKEMKRTDCNVDDEPSPIVSKQQYVCESQKEPTFSENKDESPLIKSNSPQPQTSLDIDCPPAKRARIQPIWLTANENSDSNAHSSNDVPTQESTENITSPAVYALKYVTKVDSDAASPASSDGTIQSEPANEPDAVLQEVEMEIDSDNSPIEYQKNKQSNLQSLPAALQNIVMETESGKSNINSTPAPPPDIDSIITEKDYEEFAEWCALHKLGKLHIRHRSKPLGYVRHKGVIRLFQLHKHMCSVESIYTLIKKYTWHAAPELCDKIANIYIDTTSSVTYNMAYIKWRNEDALTVVKAYKLLSNVSRNRDNKLVFGVVYDDRSRIEWDDKDRPIINKKGYVIEKFNIGKHIPAKGTALRPPIRNHSLIKPFINGVVDFSDTETFGLNASYLRRFGIKLPLTNVVTVRNMDFQIDDGSLWKIFSPAGIIYNIETYFIGRHQAVRIQYDHPLEAVQAVTMFDQQIINNRMIIVKMCKIDLSKSTHIREGFTAVGPGLGPKGAPMQSVRTTIEVGLLKSKFDFEITQLKQKVEEVKLKLAFALKSQAQLEKNNSKQENTPNLPEDQNAPLRNPLNAISLISSIAGIMSMLGVQRQQENQNPNNMAQSAPNAETHSWTPAVEPNISANTPMQPGHNNLEFVQSQLYGNMQQVYEHPFYSNIQLLNSPYVQPGVQNPQNHYENVHQGYIQTDLAAQPSNIQLAHWNTPIPLNNQPALANMQPGQTQPNIPTSNTQTHPQSSIVQSNFSNLKPVTLINAPGIARPGVLYDSNNQKPVSRFDIPPPNLVKPVKPNHQHQTLSNLSVTMTSQPTVQPIGQPIPSIDKATVQSAFNVQNNKATKVAPKPGGIKFNIPSLQPSAKSAGVEVKSLSTSNKQPAYSNSSLPTTSKSKPEEPWIKKQIKAMRRNSKSPENARNVSPKYEKYKDETRSRERETERYNKRVSTVIFKYLPSSVTLYDLKEKMREIGKLVDVKTSGKGTASVTFRNRCDAETCVEMYNRAKVDDQTIEVKWAK